MKSIFVAVPSIQDDEFIKTLDRCIGNSSGKYKISIGAVGIYYPEDSDISVFHNYCIENNINYKIVDRNKNIGTGIARKTAATLYSGEDYYLQIDSHSDFYPNWDDILVNKYNVLKKLRENEKFVITSYPPEYRYISENITECYNGWENHYISKFTDDSLIEITNHGYGCDSCEEWTPLPKWVEIPVKSFNEYVIENTKISGAYLFGDRNFALDYQNLIKWNYAILEEELVMSIEAYNLGWKFYTLSGIVPIAHLYAEDINKFSGTRSSLEESDVLKLNVKQNYLNYVLDPNNKDKIERFEKHANVDIIHRAEVEKRKVEK
jgi:hypothetical protein